MLNILVENFEDNLVRSDDRSIVDECLAVERSALMDVEHLESEVIGKADLQWDYDALGAGFSELIEPFMEEQSGIPFLFLRALRELDSYRPEYFRAMVLLEYFYYGTLINDFYNLHDHFAEADLDLRECARLTQLRYAATYLGNYPRYLLVGNKLGVDAEVLFELHRWVSGTYVTLGISRGVFVKWSRSCFANLNLEHYFQNAINFLCVYLLYPVVFAAILSKMPKDQIRSLKRALSHLTLFVKFRCEKRAILGELDGRVDPYHESSLMQATFPGVALVQEGLAVEAAPSTGLRYPRIKALCGELLGLARREACPRVVAGIEKLEQEHFGLFLAEPVTLGRFGELASALKQCFGVDA